jgi:hypothetical protein
MVRRSALGGIARRLAAAAPLVLAALTGGCTQGADAPGGAGYVLLDHAAREVTTLEQDGWEGAPLLPVALDAAEPVTLRGPDGERSVALKAGMLAHVRGAGGEIAWLAVGEDIRDDRLLVHGTEAAATQLADWIGGERAARVDGLWSVSAPDILERGSFLQAPDGILEVLPDTSLEVDELIPRSALDGAILGPGAMPVEGGAPAGGRPVGSAEAELVGVYAAGNKALWLDAAGGFSLEDRCTGEVVRAGRFFAVDDRVVLQSAGNAPMVLGRDRDRLILPGSADFAPLLPEMPKVEVVR